MLRVVAFVVALGEVVVVGLRLVFLWFVFDCRCVVCCCCWLLLGLVIPFSFFVAMCCWLALTFFVVAVVVFLFVCLLWSV